MTPSHRVVPAWALVGSAVLLAAPVGLAQQRRAPAAEVQAQVETLRRQIAEQQQQLDRLREALGEQDARYQQLVRQLEEQMRTQDRAQAAPATPPVPEPARTVQVGSAPPPEAQATVVPQLFEQPGVLTPRGRVVLEPSLQYGYSSSHRAILIGYTVIPAVLIGLVDVREVRRNTLTAALAVRYGLGDRSEVELRVPYVYRSDSTVSREVLGGAATDSAFEVSGSHLGDVEVTGRYQLTDGGGRWPYLIASLRFKSRTGRDPFEVTTDCVTRCVANATGTGQPLELPTGSGFYTLQPAITWLVPSDPAVFFGSFTFAYNFKRSDVSRQVLGGEREFIGEIKPGHVFGFNVGMGLSLNDKSSFSIGVDVSSIGRTRQNGVPVAGSVRTQLASLVLGYSHAWDARRTVNLSIGAGLTRDTPDLTLTLRVPFML